MEGCKDIRLALEGVPQVNPFADVDHVKKNVVFQLINTEQVDADQCTTQRVQGSFHYLQICDCVDNAS